MCWSTFVKESPRHIHREETVSGFPSSFSHHYWCKKEIVTLYKSAAATAKRPATATVPAEFKGAPLTVTWAGA